MSLFEKKVDSSIDLPGLELWEDKAIRAREKRDASLAKVTPRLQGIPETNDLPLDSRGLPQTALTPREIEITEGFDITQLLSMLKQRHISVEEVTLAFLRRAAVAHAAVSIPHHRKYDHWSQMLMLHRPIVSSSFSGIKLSSAHAT